MDGIELKPPDVHHSLYKLLALSLAFLSKVSFPQLIRQETDMVASYRIVPYLQHCYAWVITSSAVHNY